MQFSGMTEYKPCNKQLTVTICIRQNIYFKIEFQYTLSACLSNFFSFFGNTPFFEISDKTLKQ